MIKNGGKFSAVFLFLIADIKPEKSKGSVSVIFHSGAFRKFSCVDAESGNAGKFHIRKIAGFAFGYGAGITEAAAAGTYHKSLVTFLPELFHKAKTGSVMLSLRFFDCFSVFIIGNGPDALENDSVSVFKNTFFHFFGGSAIRWTGIVNGKFSAKIFRAIGAERFVKNDICGIDHSGIGEAFLFSKGNKHFVGHIKNLLLHEIRFDFTANESFCPARFLLLNSQKINCLKYICMV